MTKLNSDRVNKVNENFNFTFKWLEELVYNAIIKNYNDAHSDEPKKVAHEFDKVGD